MVSRRYRQRTLAEMWFRESVDDCWEPWMRQADTLLDDPELVEKVYDALARRWPRSLRRGRGGTPAEVVLRLLLLKHVRNWSYRILEREVRANLVYRLFTRIGAEKVPDAKTLGKIALALGPDVIEQIHQRLVALAKENKLVAGRQLRLDTTVVETNIHYPTDSSLLSDGGAGVDAHHKKDAAAGGPGRDEAARPLPQCEASADRDWARQPQPRPPKPGKVRKSLPQAAGGERTRGGASQAFLGGGRRQRQALFRRDRAGRLGGLKK